MKPADPGKLDRVHWTAATELLCLALSQNMVAAGGIRLLRNHFSIAELLEAIEFGPTVWVGARRQLEVLGNPRN